MSKDINEERKQQIGTFFKLSNALLINIENYRSFSRVKNKLDKLESVDTHKTKTGAVEKFKKENRLLLRDGEKAEKLKAGNLDVLKLILNDLSDVIDSDTSSRLLEEFEKHEKDGISRVPEILSEISKDTGVENKDAVSSDKEYGIDNYFLDMAVAYGSIAKGLKKTIEELEVMIDTLDELIYSIEDRQEAQSAPSVESSEKKDITPSSEETVSTDSNVFVVPDSKTTSPESSFIDDSEDIDVDEDEKTEIATQFNAIFGSAKPDNKKDVSYEEDIEDEVGIRP